MPPGPSSPASIPTPRNSNNTGIPRRDDKGVIRMLNMTSAAPISKSVVSIVPYALTTEQSTRYSAPALNHPQPNLPARKLAKHKLHAHQQWHCDEHPGHTPEPAPESQPEYDHQGVHAHILAQYRRGHKLRLHRIDCKVHGGRQQRGPYQAELRQTGEYNDHGTHQRPDVGRKIQQRDHGP